jgi:hypothetical protein
MSGPRRRPQRSGAWRSRRELAAATLSVIAVILAVAVVVFGLIVVLYDHGEPAGPAAVSGLSFP